MRALAASLLLLIGTQCSALDYTVSRGTTIRSERPIALLVLEAGLGVIYERVWGANEGSGSALATLAKADVTGISTVCKVDGKPLERIGVFRSLGKIIGFVLWDAPGKIERVTQCVVNRRHVSIRDRVENGRVHISVTVGPPLGDPRVRCAVLELEAKDVLCERLCSDQARLGSNRNLGTRLSLSCAAVIDLPGDRCRLIRRIATKAAQQEAGPELSRRIARLRFVGEQTVGEGRKQLGPIIEAFLIEVCR